MTLVEPDIWPFGREAWRQVINCLEQYVPHAALYDIQQHMWRRLDEGNSHANYQWAVNSQYFFVQLKRSTAQQLLPKKPGDLAAPLQCFTGLSHEVDWVPSVIYANTHCLITEWFVGHSLSELTAQLTRTDLIHRLASYLRSIHCLDLSGWPVLKLAEHLENYQHQLQRVNPQAAARIKPDYEEAKANIIAPTKLNLCHFDLSPSNVLLDLNHSPESHRIIDWEYAAAGVLELDLAMTAENFELTDTEFLQLINGYCDNPADSDFIRRCCSQRTIARYLNRCWYLIDQYIEEKHL